MYQDPEGIHSLDQSDHSGSDGNDNMNNTDDEYYKSRIMNLNEEIMALNKKNKSLNDELAMVGSCVLTLLLYVDKTFSHFSLNMFKLKTQLQW